MKEEKVYTLKQDDGELKVTFGDLANQASNSLIISKNETVVLVTIVISDSIKDIDYFPLSVEYEEKFYSIGAILGSRFMRREGRPSDFAVLKGRIIDRTVRPLFDHSIRNEVQVVITTLGIGRSNPDVLGTIGTSIALATSTIPWNGPVSSVRVVKKEGEEWNASPENDVEEKYDNEMVICGTEEGITMIEVEADQMKESEVIAGMEYAKGYIDKLQKFQKEIIQGQSVKKKEYPTISVPEDMRQLFRAEITEKLISEFNNKEKIKEIKANWEKIAGEKYADSDSLIERCFEEELDDVVHRQAIESDKRIDGRKMDEVRSLFVKAGGISPSIHGTGVFYRGETHVLSALTLASPGSALLIESVEDRSLSKKFIHHYNFPPFSTGEVGRVGGFNRRMIGHGALAEKALSKIIPSDDEFPYTIRLVSECMSSNGSTSMASVCAGCIALMDGGVPIKNTQAGIAIGLMKKGGKYKILTDIQGPEDHYGDMDLKIAGTRNGITAIQMDIKIDSVSIDILKEAFERGRKAREQIIDKIESVIKEPRKDISDTAPSIVKISIDPEKIGKGYRWWRQDDQIYTGRDQYRRYKYRG